MTRKSFITLCLLCVLAPAISAGTSDGGQNLNKPIPMEARRLAILGTDRVAHGAVREGLTLLRKAIVVAPNYIWAHEQYVASRAHHQGQYDEVRAEYERLMAAQPDNPIYPLVIAETARVPRQHVRSLLERVIKLAPNWAWAHLAKSRLYEQRQHELEVAELNKCLELDETAGAAYFSLAYILEKDLGRIPDAISVAKRWAAQPEFRAQGLHRLWQLQVANAKGTKEALASLDVELKLLMAHTRDIVTLGAIRWAYLDLLKDSAAAENVENKIRRIDRTWYPERGHTLFVSATTEGGIPRPLLVANRQYSIFRQVEQIDDLEPREKMVRLSQLLSLKPGREMSIHIYQQLLRTSEKLKDRSAFVRYGEALLAQEPDDTGLMSKIAIALADQKTSLKKALGYARTAADAENELHPIKRPRNTPPEWFAWSFSDSSWRENHKRQRALALDAVGWVLYQMGDFAAAEGKLRQSCALVAGERNFSHLSQALRKLGRSGEADEAAHNANNAWLESLKRQFVNKPSSDFQLEGLAGQRYKLSELKGKVVLLEFWATWCGPCVEEMPHLVKLYEKYRGRGFELLAISVDADSDRYKVAPFAETHKLTFPVLFDEGVSTLYNVKAYPTTIFLDREGRMRYVSVGFDADRPRALYAIANELLK